VDEGELKDSILITTDKMSSQGHLGHNHASRESPPPTFDERFNDFQANNTMQLHDEI